MNSASVAAEANIVRMHSFTGWLMIYLIESKRFYWSFVQRRHRIYHLPVSIIECACVIYWLITPEKKSVRRLWAIAGGNKFSLFLISR